MIAAQTNGAVLYLFIKIQLLMKLPTCCALFCPLYFAEDQEQVDKILEIQDKLPELKGVIFLDEGGMRKYDRSRLYNYPDVQAAGENATQKQKADLAKREAAQTGANTCAMLYTSGTTGQPKGVVLSNDNIIKTAEASSDFDKLSVNDPFWPICRWLGWRLHLFDGSSYVDRFCVLLP